MTRIKFFPDDEKNSAIEKYIEWERQRLSENKNPIKIISANYEKKTGIFSVEYEEND